MQVRLMVVDDSAFMRMIISDAASKIEGVIVVGTARNGLDAIENIERYSAANNHYVFETKTNYQWTC